jgi:hypothetical protein
VPGPANWPFFQVPRVAHLSLIHRKNPNFFEPDKIVILHKLIFYKLIRGAFVTLPRRKGPVPGPQPEPPVRLGFPVWPPQLAASTLFAAARIPPALKFLRPQIPWRFVGKKTQEDRGLLPHRQARRRPGDPRASSPSLQAPMAGSRRLTEPTCKTAQGLTINYSLVMFGARPSGAMISINFGNDVSASAGLPNPPGLFCTPARRGGARPASPCQGAHVRRGVDSNPLP